MTHFQIVQADHGITRQVQADHPNMMVVEVNFAEEGAVGKSHSHHHTQATYVKSGRFSFTIDDKEMLVGPGDSFVISSHVVHGCICIEPGTLIDCFTPRRDDFL